MRCLPNLNTRKTDEKLLDTEVWYVEESFSIQQIQLQHKHKQQEDDKKSIY